VDRVKEHDRNRFFSSPSHSFGQFADDSYESSVFLLEPHVVCFEVFQHLQLLQRLGEPSLQVFVLETLHVLEGVVVEGRRGRIGRRFVVLLVLLQLRSQLGHLALHAAQLHA